VFAWVKWRGNVRGHAFDAIRVLKKLLSGAEWAVGAKVSVVGNADFPFVPLFAQPPDEFVRKEGHVTRGRAAVSCQAAVTGQFGLYSCEVIIGTDSGHPSGASSVRFWHFITHLSETVTKKVDRRDDHSLKISTGHRKIF
jgi:hypothetical protein